MVFRLASVLVLLMCLAGCRAMDGTFLPGCDAYAGDRIELRSGSFEWDRFTDAIQIDADGNRIDSFPNYPKRGRYAIDGARLILTFAEDGSTASFHLYEHESMGLQLLTDAQLAAVTEGGLDEDCALTRVGRDR